jgi:hypothetical protein
MVHTGIQEHHAIILHGLTSAVHKSSPTRVCLCTAYGCSIVQTTKNEADLGLPVATIIAKP